MARKRQNGEGSIYQRKDGTWAGVYTSGFKPDGKLNRKWVYGRTAAEVLDKLNAALAQLQSGAYVEPGKMTVSGWLSDWLSIYARRPGSKTSTADEYERVTKYRILPYLGPVRLQKLRAESVQQWVNQLSEQYAPASVRAAHRVLHMALKRAVKNRIIPYNPAQDILLPKQNSHIENPAAPLSESEQEQLLDALPDTACGRALAFMIFTGLRVGECSALSWDCVQENSIFVRRTVQRVRNHENNQSKTLLQFSDPKTEFSAREIPLTSSARSIIARQRAAQAEDAFKTGRPTPPYVFASSTGSVIEGTYLSKILRDVCARVGLKQRSPHDLRHTFGTRLNERGVDPNTIARLMGHSSPTVTMQTYIHVDTSHLRRAMDRLEA